MGKKSLFKLGLGVIHAILGLNELETSFRLVHLKIVL